MRNRLIHQALNGFILFTVSIFFVLAVYSAVGQKLLPRLTDYRAWLERYVSARIEGDVRIEQLQGTWEILTPGVHLEGLSLQVEGENEPRLAIASVDAQLDVSASIFKFAPVFSHIRISGLSISVPADNHNDNTDNSDSVQSLIETLLIQHEVSLDNISVHLHNAAQSLHMQRLSLRGDGKHRLISGSLLVGDEKQIQTSFTLYSENSPYDLDEFYARGDMAVPDIAVLDWLALVGIQVPLKPVQASARLQMEFKEGRVSAYLQAASPSVRDDNSLDLRAVQLALWLRQTSDQAWELVLDKLAYQQAGKPVLIQGIRAGVDSSDQLTWHLGLDSLDIPQWRQLLLDMPYVPAKVNSLLAELNPGGEIYNANMQLWQDDSRWHFRLSGDAQALQVAAYHGAPAIDGLNGHFEVTESGGEILFDTPSLAVEFGPSLYDAPLTPQSASGRVVWQLSEQQVYVYADHLQLGFVDGKVAGGFQLWLPLQGDLTGQLLLNLSIDDLAFAGHSYLVPNVAGQGTRDWLAHALGKGRIPNGNLLLFTELTAHPNTVTELYLGIQNGELKYLADWPQLTELKGDLWLDNHGLSVAVASGKSLGGSLHQGAVHMPLVSPLTLSVGLQQKGQASEVFRYFTESPLQEIVNHGLDHWQLNGQEQLNLALQIPLGGDAKLAVQADTHLQDVDLHMADVGLSFNQINGSLGFSSGRGLYSKNLDARLWQQAMQVQVKSDMEAGMVTDFAFRGSLASAGLKDWLKLDFLSPLTGNTPVTGKFALDTRAGHDSHLDVNSDMQGLAIDLPAPFGKTPQQARNLNVNVSLAKKQVIRIGYDTVLNLALALRKGQLQGGQIFIGSTPAFVPGEPGIEVAGHLNDVNVEEWQAAIERIMQAMPARDSSASVKDAGPVDSPLRHIDVSVDRIRYQQYEVENTHFLIDESNANWQISTDSPLVKGIIRFPHVGPIALDLDYLHLPAPDASSAVAPAADAAAAPAVDVLAGFDPHNLPAVDAKVKEIFVGPRNYGQWDVELRSNQQGARLHINSASIKKLNIAGNVDWTLINGIHDSVLSLKLNTTDVGGIQRAWQMKAAVEAEKGQASADVNWRGSPAGFNLASLKGVVDMRMEKGRFVEVKDADALKAFGALNFGTISRRLTLDFSDLYQSGVHFDSVRGKATVDNGLITIVDTLKMDGPGVKFATSGTVNLNTKQLNQELFVTIPVSSSLPLVAILAGLAPPVAASIYVGEKLVGNEIERFTSASYTMTGSWEDPKLEIKQRFDNKIEGKKEKSLWQRVKGVFGADDD